MRAYVRGMRVWCGEVSLSMQYYIPFGFKYFLISVTDDGTVSTTVLQRSRRWLDCVGGLEGLCGRDHALSYPVGRLRPADFADASHCNRGHI